MVSIHLNPKKAAYQDLLVALNKLGVGSNAIIHENDLKLNADLSQKNLYSFNTKGKQNIGLVDDNDIFYATHISFFIQKHQLYKDSAGNQKRAELKPPVSYPCADVFCGKKRITVGTANIDLYEWQSIYQLYKGLLHIKNDGKDILDYFDMQKLMRVSKKQGEFQDHSESCNVFHELPEAFFISGKTNAEIKLELKTDFGLDLMAGGINKEGTAADNMNSIQFRLGGFYVTNASDAYQKNKDKL